MAITAMIVRGFPMMYSGTVTSVTGTELVTIVSTPLPTDNLYFIYKVKTSAGANRAGTSAVYDKATGVMTVTGVTATDVITVHGQWASA
jgi:hypothetical protein